jgi:glucuronoarabinoxylan endo-1,4-beta-xylanase
MDAGNIAKVVLLLFLCSSCAKADTAIINWAKTYQQIDGFGASSAFEEAPLTPSQASFLFSPSSGIGLSLLRTKVPDDGSCASVNASCAGQVSDMQLAIANGARVWSAPWSPPAAMKSNGSIANGGSLTPASYGTYATYLSNYIKSLKSLYGISLYALSVQNEPDYNASYDSAVWTEQSLHDFIRYNLGPALAANGQSSVRIMLPETQGWRHFAKEAVATMNDPAAAAYVTIAAWHDYDMVSSIVNPFVSNGKRFWETEVSAGSGFGPTNCGGCWDPSITDALLWAAIVDNRLVAANANAWNYWWLVNYKLDDNQGLINLRHGGTVSKRAYMLGNYSKFVRPGYVRISATHAPEIGVSVSAYKSKSTGGFAIVVTNQNGSDVSQDFELKGVAATEVIPWITSATFNLIEQHSVRVSRNTFSYALPAKSIITFVGVAAGSSTVHRPHP